MKGLYRHAISAVDQCSGQVGAFLHAGDQRALSPVFTSVLELYAWMRENNWQCLDLPRKVGADLAPDDFLVVRVVDDRLPQKLN